MLLSFENFEAKCPPIKPPAPHINIFFFHELSLIEEKHGKTIENNLNNQ